MMLHTVNKSPFEKDSLATCLRLAKPASDILLIEDAVYAALTGTRMETEVKHALRKFSIYALKPDLEARGLKNKDLIEGIKLTDYCGFVDLAVNNDKTQTWL